MNEMLNRPLNICIFEPEEYARRVISQAMCSIEECRVVGEGDSVFAATKIIGACNPDAIITDIQLADGVCTDFLSNLDSRMPIVLMVGCESIQEILIRISPFHILSKPVSEKDIHSCIKHLLNASNKN